MYTHLSAPLSCQVEVTSACNQKCIHCYNHWRQDCQARPHSTPLADAGTITDKLAAAQVFDMVLTGGEPLLAFDTLCAYIAKAKTAGMRVSLNSNLLLLTAERADELRKLGVTSILTSLMGPDAETHDGLAQCPGAFGKLMGGIRTALDAGIAVTANMVVSKRNLATVKETARIAKSLGVRKFCATSAACPGNCRDFTAYSLSHGEFRSYLRDLAEAAAELDIQVDTLEGYALCGVGDLDTFHFTVGRKCTAGVSTITVASDGSVRPCPHLDTSAGNLITEELPVIWGRLRDWREGAFLPERCKPCKLLGVCGGGCRMSAKMERGSLSELDPLSDPPAVDEAVASLKRWRAVHASQPFPKEGRFLMHPYRTRPESFGVVARSRTSKLLMLDLTGFAVLAQLQPGETYGLTDGRIDWKGLDAQRFVTDLMRRGFVTLDG